jgi:hypothetical protein
MLNIVKALYKSALNKLFIAFCVKNVDNIGRPAGKCPAFCLPIQLYLSHKIG